MITLRYDGKKQNAPRLDRFITETMPELPQGLLHKYLRQNKIKLNGKKCPLDTRLSGGDEVTLYLPPTPDKSAAPDITVLYEDDVVLAVYKPAGLITLHEDGQEGDSLLRRVCACATSTTPLPCHRLDTGTSGVVLFAKTQPALEYITGLIHKHALVKIYYGLCFGRIEPAAGVLRGHLLKDPRQGVVRVVPATKPGAKPVETAYRTLAKNGPLSLLELRPATGRTHQIRAQLAAAGTPLLGDSKYGDLAANRRYKCRYQCLCAVELRFPEIAEPGFAQLSGKRIRCESPWFYQQALDGEIR